MKKILISILFLIVGLGIGFYIAYYNYKNKTVIKKTVSNELFSKYYSKAEDKLKKMSLEEKVGQVFLVRYDKEMVNSQVNDYYPGGYVLFARDIDNHTKESLKTEIDNFQSISKIPLTMAVDEEGGYVTRVSRFQGFRSEKFKSNQEIYNTGGYPLLEATEAEKAKLLLDSGFNLNLAPVADVSVNPEDFMYIRSFGRNAKETSIFIKNMVSYANKNKISSCLKHFPGYGNNGDTHTDVVIDNRSYDDIKNNDFLPFESGIKEGVPCILVSHNVVNSIDSSYPSSLSSKVIGKLRNTLKFSGIVITDDLAMGAVNKYVSKNIAPVLAINAGNDMIITSDFEIMYKQLLDGIKNETVNEEKLDIAVKRILAWKYAYGLF